MYEKCTKNFVQKIVYQIIEQDSVAVDVYVHAGTQPKTILPFVFCLHSYSHSRFACTFSFSVFLRSTMSTEGFTLGFGIRFYCYWIKKQAWIRHRNVRDRFAAVRVDRTVRVRHVFSGYERSTVSAAAAPATLPNSTLYNKNLKVTHTVPLIFRQ
mgnify:CR=1 FL=1